MTDFEKRERTGSRALKKHSYISFGGENIFQYLEIYFHSSNVGQNLSSLFNS